jgi:hypothetical protein
MRTMNLVEVARELSLKPSHSMALQLQNAGSKFQRQSNRIGACNSLKICEATFQVDYEIGCTRSLSFIWWFKGIVFEPIREALCKL